MRPRRVKEVLSNVILGIIYSKERATGYEVCKSISELLGGIYRPSPGFIYPILRYLKSRGLIEQVSLEETRYYVLTESGREYVEKNKEAIEDTISHLKMEKGNARARLFLSMKRLFRLIMMYHDEIDDEKAAEISTIIDETRRRVLDVLER